MSFGKIPSIGFMSSLFSSGFKAIKASTYFIPWPSIVFICFSNALASGEYVDLPYSIFYFDQTAIFLHL